MNSLLFIIALLGFPFSTAEQGADHRDGQDITPALEEVQKTLTYYRAWLDSYEVTNVVKGTNHAARATVLIDTYLKDYVHGQPAKNEPVGIRGIRSLLLKQMRIHVDLLSTSVPAGIVNYESDVIDILEEQLNLLEQTLREFERHQTDS